MSKRKLVNVRDLKGIVHTMSEPNAQDMCMHKRWEIISEVAPDEELCEACNGTGIIQNEECWHCEGEKIDPTKVRT